MTASNEWEQFFDSFAPEYMNECFTKNTVGEVDFLVERLNLAPGSSILEIGCGTGRHSVELARRGFKVTGIDISAGMLAQAESAARAAGVEIEFVQSDATKYVPARQFDAAICLCEGAFCLLGSGDDPLSHDLAILNVISSALKPGGVVMITVLNACRHIRMHSNADVESGLFDPISMTVQSTMECDTPSGRKSIVVRERSYVPTELALMFRVAGLEVDHIGGGTAGNWGVRTLDLDEIEIMVVGRKPVLNQ